jgi:hypothetical protein
VNDFRCVLTIVASSYRAESCSSGPSYISFHAERAREIRWQERDQLFGVVDDDVYECAGQRRQRRQVPSDWSIRSSIITRNLHPALPAAKLGPQAGKRVALPLYSTSTFHPPWPFHLLLRVAWRILTSAYVVAVENEGSFEPELDEPSFECTLVC